MPRSFCEIYDNVVLSLLTLHIFIIYLTCFIEPLSMMMYWIITPICCSSPHLELLNCVLVFEHFISNSDCQTWAISFICTTVACDYLKKHQTITTSNDSFHQLLLPFKLSEAYFRGTDLSLSYWAMCWLKSHRTIQYIKSSVYIEMKMLSFQWNFYNRLHWKCQFLVYGYLIHLLICSLSIVFMSLFIYLFTHHWKVIPFVPY